MFSKYCNNKNIYVYFGDFTSSAIFIFVNNAEILTKQSKETCKFLPCVKIGIQGVEKYLYVACESLNSFVYQN